MNLLDRLALAGRRYERRRSAINGNPQLGLEEVLRIFKDKTILEQELIPTGQAASRALHSVERPVSIIDGIAAISAADDVSYEVLETPPSGDYARIKITARPSGGELSCLIGKRLPEHSNREDPLLETLRNRV